jgi:hypothetical protein
MIRTVKVNNNKSNKSATPTQREWNASRNAPPDRYTVYSTAVRKTKKKEGKKKGDGMLQLVQSII